MPEDVTSAEALHKEAEELLPWYATGELDAQERALVEQHVSNCAHCRRQLEFERRMIEEFAGITPDLDMGWSRLHQRLQSNSGGGRRITAGVRAAWQNLTRPPVAALAFAQLAFVIVAASVLLSLSRPSYHALGSEPAPNSANVIAMFRADTTQSELTALLRSNGASLVGGPTSTDAYLLRVPPKSREQALTALRTDRRVLLAQPIDGSGS